MAIKFLLIAAILAATVLTPIHSHFNDRDDIKPPKRLEHLRNGPELQQPSALLAPHYYLPDLPENGAYLSVYLVFVYLYSGLAFYFLYTHTLRVIRVRQDYLGHQCTITDRTIRISGIPRDMRSEEAIKKHVEGMSIGTVESVTICRDWKKLDNLMLQRDSLLRKLEEAWTVYLSRKTIQRSLETLPIVQPDPPSSQLGDASDEEPLLNSTGQAFFNRKRPQITFWNFTFRYGFPIAKSRKVDAIDHYTVKLEVLDAKIEENRRQEFRALPVAFVTLNSVAAAVSALS